MHMRRLLVVALVVSVLASPSVAGAQHVVDQAAMRQAMADQAAIDQQNRDAVTGLLQSSDVQGLANRLGLNLTRAADAVSTLSSAELANLADSARTAEAQLAGGANTVVISATTLLLIIIIVILVAR
jgi:hypothetical protein